MPIDGREVRGWTPPATWLAGSGQQGLDHLVAQDHQRREGTHAVGSGLVAPCAFDLAHQLLGSQLLQVVGGTPRPLLGLAAGLNLRRQRRSRKAPRPSGQNRNGLGHGPHPRLVQIDPPDAALAHPSRPRQLFQELGIAA